MPNYGNVPDDDVQAVTVAAEAAEQVVRTSGAQLTIHTTVQGRAGPSIVLGGKGRAPSAASAFVQRLLPFAEEGAV